MTPFKEKLGEILIRKKIITGEQLTQALTYQKENRVRLGSAIVRFGFTTEAKKFPSFAATYTTKQYTKFAWKYTGLSCRTSLLSPAT